ncbi:unnamed protein product, partial [marine sediment metagenome]
WFVHHEKMGEFRGLESQWDCKYTEAYARQGFSEVLLDL